MQLEGKVAVVTGGASGIGRALARRLAAQRPRGVVVADLDAEGAEDVALGLAELGAAGAIGLGCDVSDADRVAAALVAARQAFGRVDLFCANAGVALGAGLSDDADAWERSFAVNVRAHIVAARLLLPEWIERGAGYFLATASAAGLLSQIGSAPYAVSKHAAVGFAEWLSITYGARGVRVRCLCPMGVDTPLLAEGLGAAEGDTLGARVVQASGPVLSAEEVAEATIAGLRAERFLILPHPEVLTHFQRKASDYERWLAGMRALQARVEGASSGGP